MQQSSNTLKNQYNLAEYCRTGESTQLDGVTPNRIHHYRRLIFNIALDTLSTAFPISKKLLGSDIWREMVDLFYSNSTCTSPFVWKMPQDFFEFYELEGSFSTQKQKHPFLSDLIHFELIELEMYMMEDISVPELEKTGSIIKNKIILHPESKIILLDYPVHVKPPNEINDEDKGQYYCLCFREPIDRKILFIDLSPYFAFVIEQLFNNLTLEEISNQASESIGMTFDELMEQTIPFIEHLDSKGFVVGYD
jgi:hypothetical protein